MEPSTPILLRRDISIRIMRFIREYLDRRFIKNAFISPVPKSFHGNYLMILVSPLYNSSNEEVGEFRIYVYSPDDENLNVIVRIEWRRKMFGFWYRYDIKLNNQDPIGEIQSQIRDIEKWLRVTSDGTVRVSSMNRLFKKIKANPVKDKAIRSGMVMG